MSRRTVGRRLGGLLLFMVSVVALASVDARAVVDPEMRSILRDENRMGQLDTMGGKKIVVNNYPYLNDVLANYTANGKVTEQTTKLKLLFSEKMALGSENFLSYFYFDRSKDVLVQLVDGKGKVNNNIKINYPKAISLGLGTVPTVNLPFPNSLELSVAAKDFLAATPDSPVYIRIQYSVLKMTLLPSKSITNTFTLARFPAKAAKKNLHPQLDSDQVAIGTSTIHGIGTNPGNIISVLTPSMTNTTTVGKDGKFQLSITTAALNDAKKLVIKEETKKGDEYGLDSAVVVNPFGVEDSLGKSDSGKLLLTLQRINTLNSKVKNPQDAPRKFADNLQKMAGLHFQKNGVPTTQLDHLVLEDDFRDIPDNQSYARAILGQLFDGKIDHQVLTLRGANADETILSNPYELTVRLSPAIQVEAQPIGSLQVPAKPTLQRLAPAPQLAVQHSYANLRVFATAQPLKTSDGQQLELVYRDGHGGAPQPLRTKQLIGVTTTQPQTNLTTDWYRAAVAGSPQDKGIFVVVPPSVRQAQYSGEITWSVEDVPSSSE